MKSPRTKLRNDRVNRGWSLCGNQNVQDTCNSFPHGLERDALAERLAEDAPDEVEEALVVALAVDEGRVRVRVEEAVVRGRLEEPEIRRERRAAQLRPELLKEAARVDTRLDLPEVVDEGHVEPRAEPERTGTFPV